MPGWEITRAARKQRKSLLQSLQQCRRWKHCRTRGGELDREWEAIQEADDLSRDGDGFGAWPAGGTPRHALQEELDGGRGGGITVERGQWQWRNRILTLR
jgi:hypothetical protein